MKKKRYGVFMVEVAVLVAAILSLWIRGAGIGDAVNTVGNKKDSLAVNEADQTGVQTALQQTAEPEPVDEPKTAQTVEFEVQEEPETDPDSPAGRAAALGLPAPPEIDIDSWEFVLVNKDHPIDRQYVPEIGYAYSSSTSIEQDTRIVEALNAFAAAAEAQGLSVYLSSGYRSYETQDYLYDLKCQEYDPETAATIVSPPGTSEHQTGLCCDITDVYRSPKNSSLENTDTYIWMSAHCTEYGFIVRYPKGKEEITGTIYEPWHFRYVGKEAAEYIMNNGITLEEFVPLYTG